MEIPSLLQDIKPPPDQGRGLDNEGRCQIRVTYVTRRRRDEDDRQAHGRRHEAVKQCSFQPEPTFLISAVSLAIDSGLNGSVTL